MSGRRLVLVDGTAVLYRAFFAIRSLSTASGKPTNAVFGFIRMLKQIQKAWMPTHWAVVFDGGLPAARVAILSEYKAQRPPMPDALRGQLPAAEEYLSLSGVAWARPEGQEADDVLASVALWAAPDSERVLVATSDKDLFQVVSERVGIIPVVAGKDRIMGVEEVKEKTGVAPEQVVAWLALTGDTSDNIEGVPGVGTKTAARLLGQFGTIDGLFDRLSELPDERLRKSLAAHRDRVMRNRELVTLDRRLGCPFTWDQMQCRKPDPARLVPFLQSMEFHSMVREAQEQELF
jgi:DNA polymerase I